MSKPKEDYIVVGRVGAPYGVKGWVKINTFTQNPENIFEYSRWFIKHQNKLIEVSQIDWKRKDGKMFVGKFDFIDNREQAQNYCNDYILIKNEDLPRSQDDFYWVDLVGCQVVNLDGYNLGKVSSILETGANDVLVCKSNPATDKFKMSERLIPFIINQYIKNVDLETKTITVDWSPEF